MAKRSQVLVSAVELQQPQPRPLACGSTGLGRHRSTMRRDGAARCTGCARESGHSLRAAVGLHDRADLDPEEFRRLGHAVVDWIADYRAGLDDLPVAARRSSRAGCARSCRPRCPRSPPPLDALLDELDRVVVPASTHWQHPRFFGYFPANASLHSLLGDMLSGGAGRAGDAVVHLARRHRGRAGAAGRVRRRAGPRPGVHLRRRRRRLHPGLGVVGGARRAARRAAPGSTRAGARPASTGASASTSPPRPTPRWPRRRGWPGSARGRCASSTPHPGSLAMSPDALAAALRRRRRGRAAAGAGLPDRRHHRHRRGRPGARRRRRSAREHGAWVHVDAAWAGVAALCPELRDLLDGVELVDSFCTDAHKWLLTAFDASLLWVRDGAALPAALSITPEYLRNAASESGRGGRLPGLAGAARAPVPGAQAVGGGARHGPVRPARARPRRTSRSPRSWPTGCAPTRRSSWPRRRRWRWSACGWSPAPARRPTTPPPATVLDRVNASGAALLTHTVVDGRYVIRVAIGSVTTRPEHVDQLWDRLCTEAAAVRGEN